MIRESLAVDASNVAALVTPGNGVGMNWRASTGATTSNSMSGGLSAPYWVKVTRVGNVFTAYSSPDGSTWTQSGSTQTIAMSSSVYIGLAATSHNSNLWASATFSGVTVIPSGFYTRKLVPGSVVSFKALVNGQYVSADNGGANPLIANKTSVGSSEKFTVVEAGGGKIGFLAMANNKDVCADNGGANPLIANRTSVGSWESFTEVNAGGGNIALLANANGKYVSAANSGTNPLIANQTSIGTSETFTVNVQTAFDQWEAGYGVNSGPTVTPQNDGVSNLLKYLYNINPSVPMSAADRAALPALGLTTVVGNQYLTLTYRQNAGESGITVNLQTSTDLQNWTTVSPSDPDYFTQNHGTDQITGDPIVELGVKTAGATKKFIRLNVTLP
jgi:hypothetical protein